MKMKGKIKTKRYCLNCEKYVEPVPPLDIDTIVDTFMLYGVWCLDILLFQEKCPICGSVDLYDESFSRK